MKRFFFLSLLLCHVIFLGAQSCLPEGIIFANQNEIDNFYLDYPDCTEIEGHVAISGSNIVDLSGLNMITEVGDDLFIGDVFASNTILTDLSGLNNLTSVGGNLNIFYNNVLISVAGLEGLSSIGGKLRIVDNPYLESLTGLDNIDGTLISDLYIVDNPQLSLCDVESICVYLQAPGGAVEISGNAPGCADGVEVIEACGSIGVAESPEQKIFTIFPNPVRTGNANLYVSAYSHFSQLELTCYNHLGKKILQQPVKEEKVLLNVKDWKAGMYMLILCEKGKTLSIKKIVVH